MSARYSYRVCGFPLGASSPFPELSPAEPGDGGLVYDLLPEQTALAPLECFHSWQAEGEEPWLQFARTEEGYVLRFPAYADFEIGASVVSCMGPASQPVRTGQEACTTSVRCRPLAGIPRETIRHLFLDQVFPLVLNLRGELVMHGSAVNLECGAAAFLGESGRGKSTLAAALATGGAPLLTDDCLLLRCETARWSVIPSYPGVRLWDDSAGALPINPGRTGPVAHYTSKERFYNLPYAQAAAPLAALFFLEEAENLHVTTLRPTEFFVEAVRHSFLMDVNAEDLLRNQFAAIAELCGSVAAYRLGFPRDLAKLANVTEAIRQTLAGR